MNPSSLFVSDLDGTLLQPGGVLSPYAQERLTYLIEAGVAISIATARSIVSLREALGPISFRLPLVCGNGAYLVDPYTDRHLHVNALARPLAMDLWDFISGQDFYPIIHSTQADEDRMYIGPVQNAAMAWYLADRQKGNDPRLDHATNWAYVMAGEVVSFNVLEREAPLARLEAALAARYPDQLVCYLYENWYDPEWYWLSIFDRRATKASGVQFLMAELGLGPAQVVVFGDSYNDLSMFEMGVTAVAPANAVEEIRALAHTCIGTNDTDSVIKYIEKATGHAKRVGR